MNYRKEIDGLRALAIIPVILFHLDPSTPLSGGFLGVDVFFVISGFLITSIIQKELAQNRFSIATFYERRARRILPALFIVSMLSAFLLLVIPTSPDYIKNFGESLVSTTLFLSNVYFWLTTGYFGTASETSLMIHTWSLAVEEQFYIFFPLLMMFFYSKRKNQIFWILLSIFVLSLIISEWGWRNSSIANFYLIFSRAWELILGALVALYLSKLNPSFLSDKNKKVLSTIGLIGIIISYFIFTPQTAHPSIHTLLPTISVAMVLAYGDVDSFSKKFLTCSVFILIGQISYSLYLFHQPALALIKLRYNEHLSFVEQLVIFSFLIIVSYFSWRYIEAPFRKKGLFTKQKIFQLSLFSLLTLLLLGVILIQNQKIQNVIHPEKMRNFHMLNEAHNTHVNQNMFEHKCKFWSGTLDESFIKKFETCLKKTSTKAIVVIGDSHAMDLYNLIAMNIEYPHVISVSSGMCRIHKPVLNNTNVEDKCEYKNLLTFLDKHHKSIERIIYTQTPDKLFTKAFSTASSKDLSLNAMEEVVNYLSYIKSTYQIELMMIGMLPPLTISPINLNYRVDIIEQLKKSLSSNSLKLTHLVDKEFSTRLKAKNIYYVSKFLAFQLQLPEELIHQGKLTYSDKRHISLHGEEIFGERLIKYLCGDGITLFCKNMDAYK